MPIRSFKDLWCKRAYVKREPFFIRTCGHVATLRGTNAKQWATHFSLAAENLAAATGMPYLLAKVAHPRSGVAKVAKPQAWP